jgi:hypothetical protein
MLSCPGKEKINIFNKEIDNRNMLGNADSRLHLPVGIQPQPGTLAL